jgi:pimeloyl-ACP methyl ester carboxylesterase
VRHHDIDGLHVAEWGPPDGPVVVTTHGITSSHLVWQWFAAAAPDLRILALDLRGRGGSSTLPGPWGLERHAADVVAVLDALGFDRVPLVGHSMGGFVANIVTSLYPERVSSVLLVDGGLTLPYPPGFSLENRTAVIGRAVDRLAMTFETPEDYRAFWREHLALVDDWSPLVEAYVDFDLVGKHSRTSAEALGQDVVELYGTPVLEAAVAGIRPGTTMLVAPRGMVNEIPGLYPPERLAQWAAELPALNMVEVPDTNHYTIAMSDRGAAAVAEHARLLTR